MIIIRFRSSNCMMSSRDGVVEWRKPFNRESTAKRLGNWEVPRWAPTRARPMEMRPNPKPICDMNGHFLPGAPRGTSRCFGHYVGTWDLPKKITREVAAKLAKEPPVGRFNDWLNQRVQRPKANTAARMRGTKRGKQSSEEMEKADGELQKFTEDGELEHCNNKGAENINNDFVNSDKLNKGEVTQSQVVNNIFELDKQKEPIDSNGQGPYVPGSLTDLDKRHESYDLLVKNAIEEVHGPQEDATDQFWKRVAENAKHNETEDRDDEDMTKVKNKNSSVKLPSVNISQNFQFARKMHVGNLEHQPLPDTLGYRNLTKIAEHRDSDINVKPYAIGWKGYGASGPTCCTKLRVHRPKTCDMKKSDNEEKDNKRRPSTSASELGRNQNKPLSLMDLAICWDFRPSDHKLEPKPPKHIDGSNGSKAPAVFTMVHTPKEETVEIIKSGHTNPIFNQNRLGEDLGHHSVPYFEKDMTKEKRKDSCDVQYCPQHTKKNENIRQYSSNLNSRRSSASKQCDGVNGCGTPSEASRKFSNDGSSGPEKFDVIKDAWTTGSAKATNKPSHYRGSIESYDKTALAQGKLCQSSPNESQTSRRNTADSISLNNNNIKHKNCISCNGTTKPITEMKPKDNFKIAFKAGNPNSVQSTGSSQDSKNLKIPKMRHPYTKKSYSIPTLAPPFSIWRDANTNGYPEHWRLASVYQHAYKPPEQRRKPLIDSVYQ